MKISSLYKINEKWIKYLNVNFKTTRGKHRENISKHRHKCFLNRIPIVQEIKERI
jgi:hypothetical protein